MTMNVEVCNFHLAQAVAMEGLATENQIQDMLSRILMNIDTARISGVDDEQLYTIDRLDVELDFMLDEYSLASLEDLLRNELHKKLLEKINNVSYELQSTEERQWQQLLHIFKTGRQSSLFESVPENNITTCLFECIKNDSLKYQLQALMEQSVARAMICRLLTTQERLLLIKQIAEPLTPIAEKLVGQWQFLDREISDYWKRLFALTVVAGFQREIYQQALTRKIHLQQILLENNDQAIGRIVKDFELAEDKISLTRKLTYCLDNPALLSMNDFQTIDQCLHALEHPTAETRNIIETNIAAISKGKTVVLESVEELKLKPQFISYQHEIEVLDILSKRLIKLCQWQGRIEEFCNELIEFQVQLSQYKLLDIKLTQKLIQWIVNVGETLQYKTVADKINEFLNVDKCQGDTGIHLLENLLVSPELPVSIVLVIQQYLDSIKDTDNAKELVRLTQHLQEYLLFDNDKDSGSRISDIYRMEIAVSKKLETYIKYLLKKIFPNKDSTLNIELTEINNKLDGSSIFNREELVSFVDKIVCLHQLLLDEDGINEREADDWKNELLSQRQLLIIPEYNRNWWEGFGHWWQPFCTELKRIVKVYKEQYIFTKKHCKQLESIIGLSEVSHIKKTIVSLLRKGQLFLPQLKKYIHEVLDNKMANSNDLKEDIKSKFQYHISLLNKQLQDTGNLINQLHRLEYQIIGKNNSKTVKENLEDIELPKEYRNNLKQLLITSKSSIQISVRDIDNGKGIINDLESRIQQLKAIQQEFTDGMFCDDGGIAILWPYLESLFVDLELLNTKTRQFVDEDAKIKARALLIYCLGCGDDHIDVIAINLLLGLPPESITDSDVVLSHDDRDKLDKLLIIVIERWEALKNMSIASFQQMFLQRKGLCKSMASGWVIEVEKQVQDILLQKLPWSLGIISLPWLEGKLLDIQWSSGY